VCMHMCVRVCACVRARVCVREREREGGRGRRKKEDNLCSIKILSRIREICNPQLNISVDGRRNRDIFFEKVDVMLMHDSLAQRDTGYTRTFVMSRMFLLRKSIFYSLREN